MCSSEDKNWDCSRFDLHLKETVKELRIFYENILKSLCTTQDFNYWKFRRALGDIRSHRNPDVTLHKEFDFKEDRYRHAYIFAYSIIHTLTIYDRFSDMMMRNPSMMERISSMKDIGLCIFGGGPAFEVVAITKLLSNVVSQLGPEGRDPLQLHVTVIDIFAEWENEARCIISAVQKELRTCKDVTVNFRFIKADLTKDFLPDVVKAFKKAHFTTLNKFASDVEKARGRKKLFDIIHKLIDSMSYKSCLFLLDFSAGVFNKTDKEIDIIPCIRRIYGPSLYTCCKLEEEVIERFSVNMESIFPGVKCTLQSTISCSAWIKVRTLDYSKKLSSNVDAKISSRVKYKEREKCKERERERESEKCKDRPPKMKVKKEMQSRRLLL